MSKHNLIRQLKGILLSLSYQQSWYHYKSFLLFHTFFSFLSRLLHFIVQIALYCSYLRHYLSKTTSLSGITLPLRDLERTMDICYLFEASLCGIIGKAKQCARAQELTLSDSQRLQNSSSWQRSQSWRMDMCCCRYK